MSRKPGIGYPALDSIVQLLDNPKFQEYLKIKNDIPDGLRHGSAFFPFGRYLKEKLRYLFDIEADPTPFFNEMRAKYFECQHKSYFPLVDTLIAESKQRNRQIAARFQIFHQRDKI